MDAADQQAALDLALQLLEAAADGSAEEDAAAAEEEVLQHLSSPPLLPFTGLTLPS